MHIEFLLQFLVLFLHFGSLWAPSREIQFHENQILLGEVINPKTVFEKSRLRGEDDAQ
jgi:hypothetical protein